MNPNDQQGVLTMIVYSCASPDKRDARITIISSRTESLSIPFS
ncbi:MAG TPA: hypothetical protein PKG60_12505 [Spirochaetota bacterium]|nr:hypothetical protein [Spirochaetota bacterium]